MVLDPLVQTLNDPTGGPVNSFDPAIAYGSGTYVLAWRTLTSSFPLSYDILIQRFGTDGQPIGSAIVAPTGGATTPTRPRVAWVRGGNAFVVSWERSGRVECLSMTPLGGLISPVKIITSSGSGHDVGGNADAVDDTALFAWSSSGGVTTARVRIQTNLTPALILGGTSTLDATPAAGDVSVSASGGASGRWCVAWNRLYSSLFGSSQDIYAACVSNLGILAPAERVATSSTDETEPDIDGDGSEFWLAYEYDDGSGDLQIRAKKLTYSSGDLVPGPSVTHGSPGLDERDPAVGWTGEAMFLAWVDDLQQAWSATYRVEGCLPCESATMFDTFAADPAVASPFHAFATPDLDLWAVTEATLTTLLTLTSWTVPVGIVTDLGGGCGTAGAADVDCAYEGNSLFTHRLSSAPPGSAAYLLVDVAPGSSSIPCGPCSLLVDPGSSLIAVATVDASGDAVVPMPIPSTFMAGVQVVEQWAVAGASCSWGVDLSNALQVTVQ